MKVAIIQARMGSTRLPGKVLMKIDEESILKIQLDRIKNSKKIDKIVVATTTLKEDDVIVNFCKFYGVECFRGDEKDVLSRYYFAAKKYNAELIIRLTADCPLCDPQIIDDLIQEFINSYADFASNTVPPENSFWPDGSDVEIFSFAALKEAYEKSADLAEREHVTFYFWKNETTKFKLTQMKNFEDWSKYRFTIDYPEDFDAIKLILKELKQRKLFGHVGEIIKILKEKPNIVKINSKYQFGIGWNK